MNREIASLHGIRFFAAFHVLLFHNLYLAGYEQRVRDNLFGKIVASGYISVGLFFILSGFILSYVYREPLNLEGKKKFWINRFARIYPVFVLGLLVDAPRVLTYFFKSNETSSAFLKSMISGGGNLLMIQAWIPQLTITWNSPGWSLSNEAFFYFLFPIIIGSALFQKIKPNLTTLIFIFVFQLAIQLPFLFFHDYIQANEVWQTFYKYFPPLHLFEFIFGIFLFRVFEATKEKKVFLFDYGFPIGIAGCLILIHFLLKIPHPLYHNGIFSLFFGLMIISLARENSLIAKAFAWKPIVILGQSSFALYILHQPLKNFVYWLDMKYSWTTFLTYTGFTIAISMAVFYLYEEPLRLKIRNYFKRD